MRTWKNKRLGLGALAWAAAGAVGMSGCNIVAPVGYIVHGPEKVPKAFELDPKKVTALYIDDSSGSVLPSRAVRKKIGETADDMLLNQAKIEKVISSQDVMKLTDNEKYTKQLSLAEIGEKAQADILICATMRSYSLVQDQENFTPTASFTVRVIDVKEKKQVFPVELDRTHLVEVQSPTRAAAGPVGSAERTKLQLAFAERIGRAMANVFISHTRSPEEGLLDH